jgi:adenosylcobinamide-GDP ribazoletransferase
MIPNPARLRVLGADLMISAAFCTRLPLPHAPITDQDIARASWALPIAGVLVGLIGAVVYWSAQAFGLPALPSAALTVAATLLVTGCLHEDGLADASDGFGGGNTRERKLEIMRDSRIGTYGTCAVVMSIVLRISALASIADPDLVGWVLIAAHGAARATLPALMLLIPPARPDGLSARAGRPPPASAAVAIAMGVVLLVGSLGAGRGFITLLLVAVAFGLFAWLCKRQLGGQTGDTLGAVEQISEMIVFVSAASR